MLVITLLIFSLCYNVHSHKYYVERDQNTLEDKIHLQLEGVSGTKCDIKLLEKNEFFYHYVKGESENETLQDVSCAGKYTISTGAAFPSYYLQIKSKYATETLKIVHITDQTPNTHFTVNATAIKFTTKNVCSYPQTCRLTSGDKVLDLFTPTPNTECNQENHLTGFFDSAGDSIELSCGVNQPKIHVNRKNNEYMDFSPLEQLPYHISKHDTNKINIIFDEDMIDEICKFEIKKKVESSYTSKCFTSSDNSPCYQLCTDAVMELDFTESNDKDFDVKVSTRHFVGVVKTLRLGKSNLTVTAKETNATLSIENLKDTDMTTATCKIELRKQEFPKVNLDIKCSEDLKTVCPTTCIDATIHGLEPNTKYIAKVTYTQTGSSTTTSYIAEKLFKTADYNITQKPEIKTYYEHVGMTIAPNEPLFDGVYCKIQQKMEGATSFSPSECEESVDCSGLCGQPLIIKNLLPDTKYEFKYLFGKYISDLETNVVAVSTTETLQKINVTHTWNNTDLIVTTTMAEVDPDQICDFTFAEIVNGAIKYTYGLFDKTTRWEGKCNQEITFYNAASYKQGSMRVQARYSSEPIVVNLWSGTSRDNDDPTSPETAKQGTSNSANVGGSRIILIVGGVLIALLICAIGFLVLTKK